MTLLKLGDTTVVLEKVCAFQEVRTGGDDAQPSLKLILEGGSEVTVHGQGTISIFLREIKALAERLQK